MEDWDNRGEGSPDEDSRNRGDCWPDGMVKTVVSVATIKRLKKKKRESKDYSEPGTKHSAKHK